MAGRKRKLAGAALAAYNRKRARTAIVVASPSSPKRRRRRAVARVVRRRRRSSIGGSGGVRALRAQVWDLGGAAGYGYVTQASHASDSIGAKAKELLDKVPVIDALGAPLTHGLLLHFIAKHTGGKIRKIAGHASHAALMRAAHNLGASSFDHQKAATLEGIDDDAIELAGDIDYSDVGEYDDDDPGDE